ncbi:predicted protein [Postia placenta Mad-698-R]|uniref:Uncharacterized protein n=1 Tax=Postia placenta MAD-698-R-SB12 TaxID=670580 RepID=A0A1X6NB73_9APHY|nr:hypothetical protein POSPLADRAFT_1043441 [Postia placenta MAD-698-R-SB12]EED79920.1 predicted protein [Postia placenta Mad-698-R]OSX65851.1 hypothetical protein POSPLADRAFT_1043441 [Postia placenta MAD-698-R-SB12]
MGQYWKLANLDKRETFGVWGKLGEFFYNDFETLIEYILTPFPHPAPDSVLAKHKPYVRTMETGKALGRLDLPGEILHFIFDNITSFQDALFLTLATPLLEPFGHQRMYELICLCQQRWKGDRIICLGDYARDDDLPEGLLSETELQELQDKQLDIYGLITETYQEVAYSPKAYWLPPYDVWSCLPKRELKFYLSISNEEPNCHYLGKAKVHYWVLCNLTKQEYVREDSIAAHSNETPDGPLPPRSIGLGNVLLSLICWSWDDSIAMRYDGDLHRDRLSPPLASGGWRDISEPVVARLVANWEWE